MSKITEIIPRHNFELIRDRIGEILKDEINHQFVLTYDAEIDADILIENINPEDKERLPVINISFASGNYSLKDYHGNIKGSYIYNIDFYTNAKTNSAKDGDYRAAIRLQKLIGLCRYILDNPIYKTLGYAAPLIHRVYCGDINIANSGRNDAVNSMMGRMTFNVEVQESMLLIQPSLIAGFETTVKIDVSGKGYLWAN